MRFGRRAVGTALRLALLAYPRAFRRRFGDEMRDDFRRRAGTGALPSTAAIGALIKDGLRERGAAVARWSFWPNHHPHLYEPPGDTR